MKLLIDEPPLQVLPSLAVLIDLNEAIVLQQLHYWLNNKNKEGERTAHFRDGRWWVYNSYEGWRKQFPFWSETTIKRAFLSLEKQRLVVGEQLEAPTRDMRKWYTIDYDALERLSSVTNQIRPDWPDASDQPGPMDQTNLASSTGSNWPDGSDQNGPIFMQEITPKTTSETTHTQRADGAQRCVSVENGSRHSFDTLVRWAETQRNIRDPMAVATNRRKDGLVDAHVDAWLEERKGREQISAAQSQAAGDAPEPVPGERDDALLARFLAAVESKLNHQSFLTWFKPITQLNRDERLVALVAPNETFSDWISANYCDVVEEALLELNMADYQIKFYVASEPL